MSNIKALVGFLILGIIGLSGVSYWMSEKITLKYAPLVDAAMEIKLEGTTAHLWFEEIISGDRKQDLSQVWAHLDEADWYAQAMLKGGANHEGVFIPLQDPELIAQIKQAEIQLVRFRKMAQARWDAVEQGAPFDDVLEQQFEHVYQDFILQADQVETVLQREISRALAKNRVAQAAVLLGAILIAVLLFWIIARFEQQSKELVQVADQANREKSAFLTMMSHELRTPMNGILGMTQLLQMSEISDEQKEYCEVILR